VAHANKAEGYRSVNDLLARRKVVDAYGKYMKARGLTYYRISGKR